MLLVSSKYADAKVTIDDSPPEAIHVVFDKGKLVSAGLPRFFFLEVG